MSNMIRWEPFREMLSLRELMDRTSRVRLRAPGKHNVLNAVAALAAGALPAGGHALRAFAHA